MHLQKVLKKKQDFGANHWFQYQNLKKDNQQGRKSIGFGHIRMRSNFKPSEKFKGSQERCEDGQMPNLSFENNQINEKYWEQNLEQTNVRDKIQNKHNVKMFKRPVSSYENICTTKKQNTNMHPTNTKLRSFTSLELGVNDMQSMCSKMTESIIFSTTTIDSINNKKEKAQISNSSFERIKFLGQGKFGKVYLVRHKQTGFICALKIIDKKIVRQENVQSQFAKQLRIHSQLHCYNIIQFYGFFSDEDHFYIALQYATEGSVFSKLKGKSRLQEHQIQPIAKGICDGLKFIHAMGFVHRDIKPENIVLQFGVPKICDFGWATNCGETDLCKSYCGTPLYLSPQMIKKQFYGTSVDIWALGLVTYQLLVGRVPFRVWSQQDMTQILIKRIQFPQYIDRSEKCESFIRKCLEKQTYNRIQLHEALKHPFINDYVPGKNITYQFVQQVNKILGKEI